MALGLSIKVIEHSKTFIRWSQDLHLECRQ